MASIISCIYIQHTAQHFIYNTLHSLPLHCFLQIHTDWPSYLRNKGIFFVKRDNEGIPEIDEEDEEEPPDLLDYVTCGDIYPNVLGELKRD